MKYTQMPADAFKQIQMNAGILLSDFDPATGSFDTSDLIGATTGGITFSATQEFSDFGDDIDNCPKNTMELKRSTGFTEVKLSGTYVTVTAGSAKAIIGTADVDSQDATHIVPRNDVLLSDYDDVWFVGDYSDVNTGSSAGYIAIHVKNALSTGGFQMKTSDRAKGNFDFEYSGHYSIADIDNPPFEIYVKGST
jgi:hypothetical protein